MKHTMTALLLMSVGGASIASTPPKGASKDVQQACTTATHNVILAYKQAEVDVPITSLIASYPEHKDEILSGYKLHGDGNSEYEAYQIFMEYCLSLFKGA